MTRFINNCRNQSTKVTGAITTDEVVKLEMVWVNQTQQRAVSDLKFAEDKEQLQIETSEDGILQCHGRIQGEYPIFLPDSALFTTKVVQRAHLSTLHGGVGMVMAKVREKYWVSRLRKLANIFIKSLKRFIARRGRPTTIYLDNGSTFIAASKWLKCIRKDEELNNFLRNYIISWRFNLSRALWWGRGGGV